MKILLTYVFLFCVQLPGALQAHQPPAKSQWPEIEDMIRKHMRLLPEAILAKFPWDSRGPYGLKELSLEESHARFLDLNQDGASEIVFRYGGGSCGANYYIYTRRAQSWNEIGAVCSLDTDFFSLLILPEKNSGYHSFKLINAHEKHFGSGEDVFFFDVERKRYKSQISAQKTR